MGKASAALSVIPGGIGSPAAHADDLIDAVQNFVEARLAPLRERLLVQQAEIDHLKSFNLPETRKSVDAEIERIREAIALVRDGRDGVDGQPGPQGEPGPPGRDGRDGVGLAGVFVDRSGCGVVTLSDGTVRELGVIVGRDGKDGKDGLSFDAFEFDIEQIGDRTWRAKWTDAAGTEQTRDFRWDIVLDRGVYRAETGYEKGDAVSFGGSIWIAQQDTDTKPGQGNPHWRLAVKHGRDGRDGKDGEKGERGPEGRPGKDRL
jgi:hypothetical protein